MPKNKTTRSTNPPRDARELSEQSLTILMKEFDTLRELYMQAENSAQNLFNFYLTLVTTVIGGVVVISQIPHSSPSAAVQSQLLIIGIISFATIVGSIYSTALSIRYGNMARYAHCMNEIRKSLLSSVNVALPSFYESFLESHPIPKTKQKFLHTIDLWLAPTGTYHFFLSMTNSACMAVVLWLILNIGGFTQNNLDQSVITSFIVFIVLYFTHNFLSRFTMLRVISRLKARLGTGRDIESILQQA